MLAPAPKFGALSGIQMISIILAIAVVLALSAVSFVLNYKKIMPHAFPIAIVVLAIVSLILLNALAPSLYAKVIGALRVFVPSESSLTIAEVHPMHIFSPYTGKIADSEAWRWFSTTFFIAFAAFPLLGYSIAKKFRPEEVLILVWSGIMLFACFGQNRFAAHYAVNVALLCGFLSWEIIEFVGFRGEKRGIGREKGQKGKVKGKMKTAGEKAEKAKPKSKVSESNPKRQVEKATWHLPPELIFTVLIIGLVVFYPPLNTALASARYGGGPDFDWYESLAWLKENTPAPGLDYYALYQEPPLNETTNKRERYDYPEPAYSVISWWDYGHWITRIARRIPVASPLGQDGIGGPYRGNDPGACVFFIAKNESVANEVADALDVKYVVSDFMMADAYNAFYNKFGAMTVWANDTGGYYTQVQTDQGPQVMPSAKYYTTIVARLHIFDGTGVALSEELYLEPLRHYRLIHESPSTIITLGGRAIKYVKVFEYVPGATVQGTAPFGAIVEIATNVTSNQGQTFMYAERQFSTGTYEFIVPYSTEGPIDGGTNFDVTVAPYTLLAGYMDNETILWDRGREVRVTEEDVLGGRTVTADLA
jgi:dolichyl-diphosphooligosaccharide--protein glycosyltransferase